MINNRLYIDLKDLVDVQGFDSLHPEICRGISTAQHLAVNGLQTINDGTIRPHAQGRYVKPLYEIYSIWKNLPEDNPLKIAGKDLDYNQLTTYLKFAFGAYDLYCIYKILDVDFQEVGVGEMGKHFPNLVKWILNFKTLGIFRSIHSATLMVLEAGGIPWEHCDPEPARVGEIAEFIHIKTDLDRPFYMVDSPPNNRLYINTRVAWWDETDWHGGEPIDRPTYTLRINGRFTTEFKNLMGVVLPD